MPTKKNKKVNIPGITAIGLELKKTNTAGNINTKAASDDETRARKQKVLEITDIGLEKIKEGLITGVIPLTTVKDFETLVKTMLTASGEPEIIQGNSSTETIQDTRLIAEQNMSKINEILDFNDEAVKDVYNRLFKGYNEINDEK